MGFRVEGLRGVPLGPNRADEASTCCKQELGFRALGLGFRPGGLQGLKLRAFVVSRHGHSVRLQGRWCRVGMQVGLHSWRWGFHQESREIT